MNNQYLYIDIFGTTRENKCKFETESYIFSYHTLQKLMGDVSAIVQSGPQLSIMMTNGPKQSKRVQEGPKWSNWSSMVQTDPKLPKMIQKYSKLHKIAQIGQNWSKQVHMGPKQPKVAQIGLEQSQVQNGQILSKLL